MYAEFDKSTGQFTLRLPDDLKEHFNELYTDVMNEYGFEPMNKDTMIEINNYVINWFSNKEIHLKEPKENEETQEESP